MKYIYVKLFQTVLFFVAKTCFNRPSKKKKACWLVSTLRTWGLQQLMGSAPGKWSKGYIIFGNMPWSSSDFEVTIHHVQSQWVAFTPAVSTTTCLHGNQQTAKRHCCSRSRWVTCLQGFLSGLRCACVVSVWHRETYTITSQKHKLLTRSGHFRISKNK